MIETLKTLCYLSGVSGCEEEVRDYILERIMPHADEIITDAMGNIMAFKKGKKRSDKRLMLCAHMDEVGLIVTGFTSDGFLKFDCVGGIDRRVLLGKKVYVGKDRLPGVIGVKAKHLQTGDEGKTIPKVDAMYIDIGAQDEKSARDALFLGDVAVFDDSIVEFGDGFIKAKALDDRLGCAVMITLIETDLPCDCWFAFTVQEEVGTRGAHTAAYTIAPEVALVLETTTAADIPGVDGVKKICRLGQGVVIPFMDRGTVYNRSLYTLLTELADGAGIKRQTKTQIAGGTDASAIQRSAGGVKTAGLACGLRNIHSPASVGNLSDFIEMKALVELFLKAAADGRI